MLTRLEVFKKLVKEAQDITLRLDNIVAVSGAADRWQSDFEDFVDEIEDGPMPSAEKLEELASELQEITNEFEIASDGLLMDMGGLAFELEKMVKEFEKQKQDEVPA